MAPKTLKDIINYGATTYGEQAAYRYKVRKEIAEKTYLEVQHDSMAVSRMVEKLEMKGKHIAIIGTTTYEWIVSFFGVTNSTSVAVPIDVQLPVDDICELLERADVEMLIYDELRKDVAAAVKEKCPQIQYLISMQAEEATDGVLSLHRLLEENQGDYDTDIDPEQL